MKRARRYHRFEAVTVRAAARLAAMVATRRLAPWEFECYMRELAATERGAEAGAHRGLRRLALRRAGGARPLRLERGERGQRSGFARERQRIPGRLAILRGAAPARETAVAP
jgi:hypothetical protein